MCLIVKSHSWSSTTRDIFDLDSRKLRWHEGSFALIPHLIVIWAIFAIYFSFDKYYFVYKRPTFGLSQISYHVKTWKTVPDWLSYARINENPRLARCLTTTQISLQRRWRKPTINPIFQPTNQNAQSLASVGLRHKFMSTFRSTNHRVRS